MERPAATPTTASRPAARPLLRVSVARYAIFGPGVSSRSKTARMNSGKFTPTVRAATRPRLGFTRFTGDPVKIDSPIPGVGFNAFDDEVLAAVFHLKCSATMERTVVLTRHRIYLNYARASWLALAQ